MSAPSRRISRMIFINRLLNISLACITKRHSKISFIVVEKAQFPPPAPPGCQAFRNSAAICPAQPVIAPQSLKSPTGDFTFLIIQRSNGPNFSGLTSPWNTFVSTGLIRSTTSLSLSERYGP